MKRLFQSVKKNIRYYVLSGFLLINIAISAQSLMPAGASSDIGYSLSNFFDSIYQLFQSKEAEIIEPESLALSGRNTMYLGESRRITATLTPNNVTDRSIFWSTSDEEVVEITSGGIAVAHNYGLATITAQSSKEEVFATFDITVIDYPHVTSFDLEVNVDTIEIGQTLTVDVIDKEPTNGRINELIWSSQHPNIASVNDYGVIKGEGVGSTIITATYADFSDSIAIFVTENTTPIILPTTMIIEGDNQGYIYRTNRLTINFEDVIPSNKTITWFSSDETIATIEDFGIDEEGNPFADIYGFKFTGDVTITAISNADDTIIDTFLMNFDKVYPVSISLTARSYDGEYYDNLLKIVAGTRRNIDVAFDPIDVTDQQMIWTSSDTNIARVSSSGDRGLVTGIKEGIVTITAVSVLDENIVETIEVNVLKASTLSVTESRNLNIFIRKALGHVGLFFVNGIFGYLTIIYFIKKKKDHVLLFISLGIGAFLSSTAELLQFIPVGRGPMIEDVIMNFIGYFIANIVLFFGIKYYPRIKKKFEERKLKKENIKT
jgi:uncharacterized protein YjdB